MVLFHSTFGGLIMGKHISKEEQLRLIQECRNTGLSVNAPSDVPWLLKDRSLAVFLFPDIFWQLWWPWKKIFQKWAVCIIHMCRYLCQQILKVFVWFQIISLGGFCYTIYYCWWCCSIYSIYHFPVLPVMFLST